MKGFEIVKPGRYDLTRERLAEAYRYVPETGKFYVIKCRGKRRGAIAGNVSRRYRRIAIDGHGYTAAVLAWLWMTGELPPKGAAVDHRDGNPGNDRWGNLRLADRYQNMANRKPHRRKHKGLKGAYANAGRWTAIITSRHRRYYLGQFRTAEDAHAAYCAKSIELHGEYSREIGDKSANS